MENWFYIENDEKKGPFTLEGIKNKKITKDTLVWTEPMKDWEKAGDVPLLRDIIIILPPLTSDIISDGQLKTATWSAILIIIITIFQSYSAFSGELENKPVWKEIIYAFVILFSVITIITTLKKYLNTLNNYFKLDTIINFIIFLEIISTILKAIPIKESETIGYALFNLSKSISGLFILILYLIFLIRIIKIKNDFSGYLKSYAISILLCGILSIILLIVYYLYDHNFFLIFSIVLSAIPYVVLVLLFQSTRDKLKEKF